MNQEISGRMLPEPLAKRRRGRPRKDENLPPKEKPQQLPPPNYLKNIIPHIEIEAKPVDENNENNDNFVDEMVGQQVSGVIEGSFDAGYLLAVKTPPIDTVLRGVVFHPGRVCSVTPVNDIAPLAKMHPRKEILVSNKVTRTSENVNEQDQSKNNALITMSESGQENEKKNQIPNDESENRNQFQDVMPNQNQIFSHGEKPQFGIGNSFITMLTTDPFPNANPPFVLNQQTQSEQQTLDRLFSPHRNHEDRRELVDGTECERKGIEDQESGKGNGS